VGCFCDFVDCCLSACCVEFNEPRHASETTTLKDAAHVAGTTTQSLLDRSKALHGATKTLKGNATIEVKPQKLGSTLSSTSKQVSAMLAHASEQQAVQIDQIKQVFIAMDANGDGQLGFDDVKAYFKATGRTSSDSYVRQWINQRDTDKDAAVSLREFIESFAHLLAPNTADDLGSHGFPVISPVTAAFGMLRLGSTTVQIANACAAAQTYVQKVIDSPSVSTYWRIFVNDAGYQSKIGHLVGGAQLMFALGFKLSDDHSMLCLRDPNGKTWDTVPADVRNKMKQALHELLLHADSLNEPTISNIAAVSSAVGILGDGSEGAKIWSKAIETIVLILSNVLKFPSDPTFYRVVASNHSFKERFVYLVVCFTKKIEQLCGNLLQGWTCARCYKHVDLPWISRRT
jgi:hypothetical protein